MLEDRFEPLVDFMPLLEYDAYLRRCGVLIMNQTRQQGMGTVVAALWRGARVYMNDTPLYRGLWHIGVDVRLIRRGSMRDARAGFIPLDKGQVQLHRERLLKEHGREAMRTATQELLSDMRSRARADG